MARLARYWPLISEKSFSQARRRSVLISAWQGMKAVGMFDQLDDLGEVFQGVDLDAVDELRFHAVFKRDDDAAEAVLAGEQGDVQHALDRVQVAVEVQLAVEQQVGRRPGFPCGSGS